MLLLVVRNQLSDVLLIMEHLDLVWERRMSFVQPYVLRAAQAYSLLYWVIFKCPKLPQWLCDFDQTNKFVTFFEHCSCLLGMTTLRYNPEERHINDSIR